MSLEPTRAWALLFLFAAGCGSSEYVSVSGHVKLAGKPLATGTVSFQNTSGGPVGYASIQPDGSYVARTGSLVGLKRGEYQVAVVATAPFEPTDSRTQAVPQRLTPARYADSSQSGLSYTVGASSGTFDIDLQVP